MKLAQKFIPVGLIMICLAISHQAHAQVAEITEPIECPDGMAAVTAHNLVVADGTATGTFTIAPGCEDIKISLASYEANAPTFELPQTLFDSETGNFSTGPHTLIVDVPDCYYQADLVVGDVIVTLAADNLYGDRKLNAINGGENECTPPPPPPPHWPNCMTLTNAGPGDKGHYESGLHQIAGDGLLEGADDVYTLTDGNAVQCFCPPTGMGIQTNWWKTDQTVDGWIVIGNGSSWNLDDGNYLAMNSPFDCNPPVWPNCMTLTNAGPGDKAHYENGLHQIAGDGLLEGADDVYTLTDGNAVQCFCPPTGIGIQTNWWKTDETKDGWIVIGNGTSWNLDDGNYLAMNSPFDCNPPVFPNCMTLTKAGPGDKAHYENGLHQIAGGALLEGADDVYTLTDGNAVQCFCPPTGIGIQTNWWKTDKVVAGWVLIANGLVWNLDEHAYLAFNSDFVCNEDVGGGEEGGGGNSRPTLTVNKVVINDGDGDAVASDYVLKVNTTTVVNGTATSFDAGVYVVTEAGPAGYTAIFSGDCDISGNITLPATGSFTCTITNNDIPAVGGSNETPTITTTISSSGGGGASGPGPIAINPTPSPTPTPVPSPDEGQIDFGGSTEQPGQILGEELPRTGTGLIFWIILALSIASLPVLIRNGKKSVGNLI